MYIVLAVGIFEFRAANLFKATKQNEAEVGVRAVPLNALHSFVVQWTLTKLGTKGCSKLWISECVHFQWELVQSISLYCIALK